MSDLAVGDTVALMYRRKEVRARVLEMKDGRVRVELVASSARRRTFSMQALAVWRPTDAVRKVEPRASDEKSANERIDNVVRLFSRKRPDNG